MRWNEEEEVGRCCVVDGVVVVGVDGVDGVVLVGVFVLGLLVLGRHRVVGRCHGGGLGTGRALKGGAVK